MVSQMLVLTFSLSASVALAVRESREPETPINGSAEETMNFICPDECLECCQAHATGFLEFGWLGKHTNDRFKCILKDHSHLPPGCEDAEPQRRTHMGWSQYKVTCPFGDGLEGEEAEARRKTLPSTCSQHMECCCEDSDQPRDECLDLSFTNRSLELKVSESSPVEYFRRQEQRFSSVSSCANPKSEPLKYQDRPGGKFTTHGRCCIKTADLSGMHNPLAMTVCVSFEQVYHCSKDGGITPSGSFYKRIPVGTCVQGSVCPSNHFSKNCACKEEC